MDSKTLESRQRWTLSQKIDHTLGTIDTFVSRLGGLDKVYCSFSGGKDSTVLLHLCRVLFPDILAVFCNTGNEYPEIIKFVRQTQAAGAVISIIRPQFTPRQIWAKYGFPLIGKETADRVHKVRINPHSKTAGIYMGNGKFRLALKWRYLLTEPYETSAMCCNKLKKEPFHRFERETGRRPIVGTMAAESKLREIQYLRQGGCNVFGESPASKPLSIWTEADIWEYIRAQNLPIAEIYHKGAARTGCMGCGFGSQFADDTRFDTLLREHPKCYDMIMGYANNGVSFREAMRKALQVNGRFLPDEEPANLFSIL